MRTKRAIWITLLCAALVGALCAVPLPVSAGTSTVTFDAGGYAYTILSGTLVNEMAGHENTLKRGAGPPSTVAEIRINLPDASTVTHVCLQYYKNAGPPQSVGTGIWLYNAADTRVSYTYGNPNAYYLLYDNYSAYEWKTQCADVNVSGVTYVLAQVASDGAFSAHLDNIAITYTSDIPTNTPTHTATIDPNDTLPHWSYCALLGDRATFTDGWQLTGGAALNTAPGNEGLYLPGGGQATTSLSLSPSKRYSVYIAYRAGVSPPSSTPTPTVVAGTLTAIPPTIPAGLFFGWRIEGSQNTGWQIIEIPQAAGTQSYSSAAQGYSAMPSGGYALELNNPSSNTGAVPLIQYICVSEERSGGGGGGGNQGGSTVDAAACHACDDPQGVWDIQGIANWIVCKIGQFFGCTLAGFLLGIWEAILNMAMGVFAFFKWLLESLGLWGNWGASGVEAGVGVAGGQANNLITSISNGMHDSGLANGINIVSSGVRDLPTALMNILDQGGQIIGETFHSGANLLDVLGGMVNLVINTLSGLLALVPLIFQELVNGFNHATEPVSGSITCTDPNSLLWFPCYGFYVLDNTIFQGPAVYLLPILMGMMAFDTFIWALNKIKDAFAK